MKIQFSILCAFALLMAVSNRPARGTDNVLLLIADDYGVDSMGLYAPTQDVAPTPNLNALAANGILFTEFWANPICSPTRAALLTGRHGFRTGVGFPTGNNTIPLGEYTIADLMNSQGYHTANIGKWHLGNGDSGPNLMGWDHFAGITAGGVQNYYNWTKNVNGSTSTSTNYTTTEMTNDAISWINSKGDDPWFCWVAFNAPHTPFHEPPPSLHTQTFSNPATNLEMYKAAVEAMDTEIGRLLNSLAPDVLSETTVIFIGDNGTPNQVANNHERGRKGQLYQGGVHTPAIVSGKAVSGPARTNDALVHVTDLFATVAELGGFDVSTELPPGLFVDSLSAAPYFTNPNLPSFHDKAYAERFRTNPADPDGMTIRNTRYKYIRFASGTERLHDLTINGAESNDNNLIASTDPDDVAALAELRECMDTLLASPSAPQVESVVINNGDVQRSTLTQIVVNFDSNVAIDDISNPAFQLTNTSLMLDAAHETATDLIDGKTAVTITFVDGDSVLTRGPLAPTLAKGNYQLAVNASQITSDGNNLDGDADGTPGDDYLFGNVPEDNLFAIFGDSDGSRAVNFTDFSNHFLPAFGSTSPSPLYRDELDIDGDGSVNFTDFSNGFLPNFGGSP
tara:strand:- start:21346 stop:23217 length:1872 start_codon:yes stop_codon:yes gene_type:complete